MEKKDPSESKSSNPNPLTIGIVGVGDVVAKAHLPVLMTLKEFSVEWVTDVNTAQCQRVGRSFGVKWLPLPKNLENLPHTDIVLLAIPYGARPPYYEILRKRKTAVYVEKPFAKTLKEHLDIVGHFPTARVGVGLQRRAMGSVNLIKNMIDNQVFGALNSVDFRHGSSANTFNGKLFSIDSSLAGGGVLFEHGVHGLDLALYMCGAITADDYQVKTIVEKGFDVHVEGKIQLSTALGKFSLDLKTSWLTETGEGLTFWFEKASVYMSLGEAKVLLKSLSGETILTISDEYTLAPTTGFQTGAKFWLSFLDGVRNDKENYTFAGSSQLTSEVLEQIYVRGLAS